MFVPFRVMVLRVEEMDWDKNQFQLAGTGFRA